MHLYKIYLTNSDTFTYILFCILNTIVFERSQLEWYFVCDVSPRSTCRNQDEDRCIILHIIQLVPRTQDLWWEYEIVTRRSSSHPESLCMPYILNVIGIVVYVSNIWNAARRDAKLATQNSISNHCERVWGGSWGEEGCYYSKISRNNNFNKTFTKEFWADLISWCVRVSALLAECVGLASEISRKLQRVNNFLSPFTVDCCYYYD